MKQIQIKQGNVTILNRFDASLYEAGGIYEFPGDLYLYAVNKLTGAVCSFQIDPASEETETTHGGVSEELHLATIRILTGREKI